MWVGTGMSAARRGLAVDDQSLIRCNPARGDAFSLRVVPVYKHLGTRISSDGSMAPEISCRAGMIRSERARLRKRILANPAASMRTRVLLAQSFVFSSGFCNASTWSILTGSQIGKLHAAVMMVYRDITGETYDASRRVSTDVEVLRLIACPPATLIVRRARMLLFLRICAKSPIELYRILASAEPAPHSWLCLVSSDFEWLSSCDLPDPVPCVALSDWLAFARSSYKASRRAVLRACDEVKVSEDASWTRNVSHDNLSRDWICESCSCSFPTKQLLGTHMWKVHHVRRATRSHVDGTHCPACLLEFHTRDRLLRHLED